MKSLEQPSHVAEVTTLPCPVCDATSELEWRHPEAMIYRCPLCTHRFSDPNSIEEPEHYGPEYYLEIHKNWFDHPNVRLFHEIHQVVDQLNPKAAVLDVGCGTGNLLKYLYQRNPLLRLVGVDICTPSHYPGIEFRQGDAFELDLGQRFDVVISLAVIEHVADVQTFVQNLKQLCVPGGLVIVLTVNEHSLTYATARLLARCGFHGSFERLYSKHHLNHFSIASLRRLMTAQGLEVVQTLRHQSPMAAIDFEASNPITAAITRAGLWFLFQLERLTGKTLLQTIICR